MVWCWDNIKRYHAPYTPTQVGYGTQVVITVEDGAVKVFVVQNSVPMQPSCSPQPTAAVGVMSGEIV
jgi:hypothetical protein